MPLLKSCFIYAGIIVSLVLCALSSSAQQRTGSLRGHIVDQLGGSIIGAQITVANKNGMQRVTSSDPAGNYVIATLAAGTYILQARAEGFSVYEQTDVRVSPDQVAVLNISLEIAVLKQEVTTLAAANVNTDPENNAAAIILRDAELDALPDDPDELANALQALAGPSNGPEGGQIFVDGFSSGHPPAKQSIREVRINQNPFSAEFDKIGLGRVDILTKPGANSFHGQATFGFADEALNSRNPFITRRAPFQERSYAASLSGPLLVKKASFFADFVRRETDGNVAVNATVVDPALDVVPFNGAILTPRRNTSLSARIDYQLNRTNTLTARFTATHSNSRKAGLSDLTLPSVAYRSSAAEYVWQLTNTAVLKKNVINETRFQYLSERVADDGDNSAATVIVLGAFTGGGAQTGISSQRDQRWELQNFTLWAPGNHTVRAGGRIRGLSVLDVSSLNFGGTFVFAGGLAPQLNADNQIALGVNGQPQMLTITSIERYRRTLLFQHLPAAQIRALGGGATQFSIAKGESLAKVNQVDFAPFIQDDWRLRPNLTLSLGMRYERQNNLRDRTDFAPRLSFAWAPGSRGTVVSRTVIRGGFGVFYDRVSQNLTLQVNRFNGRNQQRFVVSNPDFFFSPPPLGALLLSPETINRASENLRTPYTLQSAFGIERQLPRNLVLSATFINTKTVHALRSRNINAPLPGTTDLSRPDSGVRPLGSFDNVLEYESSGNFKQDQLLINLRNRVNKRFSFVATYNLSWANSDTDGADTLPANTYDLRGEYGRSALDSRHRFVFVGVIDLPHGLSLNPFLVMRSGLPFNITTGRDLDGDSAFTERPALAVDPSRLGVLVTRYGVFDPNPGPGMQIIPRNFGEGPGFVALNLRVSKTFGFGRPPESKSKPGKSGREAQSALNIYGNATGSNHYQLTLSIQARNILNHSNLGLPLGTLSSPRFGQSNSLAPSSGFGISGESLVANRRLEAQVRLSF